MKRSISMLLVFLVFVVASAVAQDGIWRPDYDRIGRAVERGDVRAVRDALTYNHLLSRAEDNTGWTILHLATKAKNFEMVKTILEFGPEVNALSNSVQAPLHVAAEMGDSRIAGMLIAHEANVNIRNKNGETPLHCAARSGNSEIVELLLEKGAEIDAKDKKGRTALDLALENKEEAIADILKNRGKK